jgi:hypothetical protein
MAKSADKTDTPVLYVMRFASYNDMDWCRIETECGKPFSAKDRQQIFECFLAFERRQHWHQQAADPDISHQIWQTIHGHVNGILKISRSTRYNVDDKQRGLLKRTRECENAWNLISIENPKVALEFEELSAIARKLERLMDGGFPHDFEITNVIPEIDCLVEFVSTVYSGAEVTSVGTFPNVSAKRQRWGISVGQTSSEWYRFVRSVLKPEPNESKVSQEYTDGQIRSASRRVIEEMKKGGKLAD